MDDFIVANLRESKNEWCCYLVDVLTPLVTQGIRSMFDQSWNMCVEKGETNKYLMTFQNLLSLVGKWNSVTVEEERKRIVEQSGCHYLEELIVCVHIIHLKVMTHIRVGNRQKKIDISLPKLDDFLHKVYIHCSRKIYKNVYLFERGLDPLTNQKYARELELIIQQCILTTVRDSIPKEQIIRSFMDENMEQEEEIFIEPVASTKPVVAPVSNPVVEEEAKPIPFPEELPLPAVPSIQDADTKPVVSQIKFNDIDSFFTEKGETENKVVPKHDGGAMKELLVKKQQDFVDAEFSLDLGIQDLDGPKTAPSDAGDFVSLLGIEDI